MKINKIKVLGVLIIIFAIVFGIYKLFFSNNNNKKMDNQYIKQVIYREEFKVGIVGLDSINPIVTKNKEMININQLVYEPLLFLDSTYKLNNCLATEYAKTSTTTYIIKIDTNSKFSDDSNLNANDIKNTIDLLKSTNNIYSENVKNISNVEIIDDSTLKINLSEEISFFEYNLIFPIIKQTENGYVGTGKYKIASNEGNQIILEKNEKYVNTEKVNKNVNRIIVNLYNDAGELYNAFKTGNIDIINTSSIVFENYVGIIGYYTKEYKGREVDFLACNCKDYLLNQKNIRQAINYAIDKENIISSVYNNKYYSSEYILDYNSYVCNNVAKYGYYPEKAKEILIKDGWEYTNNRWRKNGTVLQFTLSVSNNNAQRVEVAQNIKMQLENIGIQVNINQLSDMQYKWCLENKNYQMLLTGIYNGYSPDLAYFYGKNNFANYENKEVFSMIDEVKNITEQKNIEEKYKKIISLTNEDCVYIGLYRNKNTLLISDNLIGNFEPSNYGIYNNFDTWNVQGENNK